MPPKSRYSRAIDASKMIARAAAMAGTLTTQSPPDQKIAIESILGQLRAALVTLDGVIEQCALARGMYLTNPTIRNTLVQAGEYLSQRQPKIANAINDILVARSEPSHDWTGLQSSLTTLAVDISSVSFDPSLTTTP